MFLISLKECAVQFPLYKIIREYDIKDLEREVNSLLKEGQYSVTGGIVIESHPKMGKIYYQALIKL
jgi:hypothetical protein